MNHAVSQIQPWDILSPLPAIPFSHCLPDPRTSPNQIFSFSSQFLRNTSYDLLNSIILPCILNLSFPNTYHIYLFNFCLPWLVIKSRTLSAFFTAVKKKIGLWSSLIKLGENREKENEKTEHLPVSLTPFTFCTYTPTYSMLCHCIWNIKACFLTFIKTLGLLTLYIIVSFQKTAQSTNIMEPPLSSQHHATTTGCIL